MLGPHPTTAMDNSRENRAQVSYVVCDRSPTLKTSVVGGQTMVQWWRGVVWCSVVQWGAVGCSDGVKYPHTTLPATRRQFGDLQLLEPRGKGSRERSASVMVQLHVMCINHIMFMPGTSVVRRGAR